MGIPFHHFVDCAIWVLFWSQVSVVSCELIILHWPCKSVTPCLLCVSWIHGLLLCILSVPAHLVCLRNTLRNGLLLHPGCSTPMPMPVLHYMECCHQRHGVSKTCRGTTIAMYQCVHVRSQGSVKPLPPLFCRSIRNVLGAFLDRYSLHVQNALLDLLGIVCCVLNCDPPMQHRRPRLLYSYSLAFIYFEVVCNAVQASALT